MSLFNPLRATEKVQQSYFRFFQSSFAPNNPKLAEELEELRDREYLWKKPYISISQPFQEGSSLANFVKTYNLSPLIVQAFAYIKKLHVHQEQAIKNILDNESTIVSSGTGSGKTEVFFIPILDYLIKNRREKGIKAIIIYPMNALVNDQVERLRKILHSINQFVNPKITFASYTGYTPDKPEQIERVGELCPQPFCGKNLYPVIENGRSYLKCDRHPNVVIDYQLLSRQEIRDNPPDILITNYVELEYLLLRKIDKSLFDNLSLKFIVLDEVHSYTGAQGIDVSFLIRRLKRRVDPTNQNRIIFIGTSATLSSKKEERERKKEIAEFASGLFGVTVRDSSVFEGKYEKWSFGEATKLEHLEKIDVDLNIDNVGEIADEDFTKICKKVNPTFVLNAEHLSKKAITLGKALIANPFFQELLRILTEPRKKEEVIEYLLGCEKLQKLLEQFMSRREELEDIIWEYLKLGSLAAHPYMSGENEAVPLIRVNTHNFFKTIDDIYICHVCRRIYNSPKDQCEYCGGVIDRLGVCRFCGEEFYISLASKDDISKIIRHYLDSEIRATIGESAEEFRVKKLPYNADSTDTVELWQTYKGTSNTIGSTIVVRRKKCLKCGSLNLMSDEYCHFCKSKELKQIYLVLRNKLSRNTQPIHCPFCNNSYGSFSALSPITMSPSTASTTLFDMIYTVLPPNYRKLLIFTDNKQVASYLAGYLEVEHRIHAMRKLIYSVLKSDLDGRASFSELKEAVISRIREWYGGDFEGFYVKEEDVHLDFLREISSSVAAQRSLESLGLMEINYDTLENIERFERELGTCKNSIKSLLNVAPNKETLRLYLISVLDKVRQWGAFKGLERKKFFEKGDAIGINLRGNKINHKGLKVKGLLSRRGTIFTLTRKIFSSDKDTTEKIITNSFDFLASKGLLTRTFISKGYYREEAYVVNSGKVILKIPRKILKCEACKRVYFNAPKSACLTWRCNGSLKELGYSSFIQENKSNHYIRLYTTEESMRMVTAEDTGAIDLQERRRIETEFKSDNPQERKIDVIVATPTLELGVDIGDLLSIGLFKAPPAPVNYIQRIGRAGRKERISFNNTFFFLNPIDMFYYDRPRELIRGEVITPIVNVQNTHMLKRHINALILEDLFVHSDASDYVKHRMYEFVTESNLSLIEGELRRRKEIILAKIKQTFHDITIKMSDKDVEGFIENFKEDLAHSLRIWKEEMRRYETYAKELDVRRERYSERIRLERQHQRICDYIAKLESKNFIEHAMDTGLLPRYAFPGIYVSIEEEYGRESFSGQNRNYAISEYAPGMEITLKKGVYESIGVDYKFTKPKQTNFYVCKKCSIYISEERFDTCPVCHAKGGMQVYNSIAPETLFLRKSGKPINEPRGYREALSDVFLKTRQVNPVESRIVDNFHIKNYGNVDIVQIVSGIWHQDETQARPIELCEVCGKIRLSARETIHKELSGRDRCNGKFQPVNLFHVMPTNVISLQVVGGSLFGIPVKGNDRRFLMTLKNAIINAAQIMMKADDGEIEGVVKGEELLLFDNVEGGVGYVNEIFNKFEEVLAMASEIVLNPEDDCERGCLKCLYSYRRRRDIPEIDKQLVRPFLEKVKLQNTSMLIQQEGSKRTYKGSEIITVHSPEYDLTGVVELKNILRSAQEEIKLTSLYVTDDKIDWPDEGRKSWVDILTSIKLDETKSVKITVIVREPVSDFHRKALAKLIETGIEVLVFQKELEEKLPAIAHEKLVVVDPQNPVTRYAIHTSANFSLEMWKNRDFYDFGRDEEWVKGTCMEILQLERESKKLQKKDVLTADGVSSIVISPGKVSEELEKLGFEVAKAEKEVCIMDPYLVKVEQSLAYLTKWIHKGVEIKIITARVDSGKLKKVLCEYRNRGYNILPVLRYFDQEMKTGKETILHDRYIIIDRTKVIRLGKGLTTVIEANTYEAKDNVIIDILFVPSLVEKFIKNFNEFWNFKESSNDIIRSFPKEAY